MHSNLVKEKVCVATSRRYTSLTLYIFSYRCSQLHLFSLDLFTCFSFSSLSMFSPKCIQSENTCLIGHSFHLKCPYNHEHVLFFSHTHTQFSTALPGPWCSQECDHDSSWQSIPFCLSLSFSYHSKKSKASGQGVVMSGREYPYWDSLWTFA